MLRLKICRRCLENPSHELTVKVVTLLESVHDRTNNLIGNPVLKRFKLKMILQSLFWYDYTYDKTIKLKIKN